MTHGPSSFGKGPLFLLVIVEYKPCWMRGESGELRVEIYNVQDARDRVESGELRVEIYNEMKK